MRINNAALIEHVAAEAGMSPKVVRVVLRAFFDVVGRRVAKGDSVAVTNFGTWSARHLEERIRHNPQTGAPMRIEARNYPRFVFSPKFRDAVISGDLKTLKKGRGNR